MDKKYDTFDYEIKRITYKDSYTSGDDLLRCVFIINGRDILEIVKEALMKPEDFHHTTPSDLRAFDLNGDPYRPGRIHPLICSCDELGCDSIAVRVTENENGVIWDSFCRGDAISESDDECEEDNDVEDLKLSFEFEKNDYKRKMEEIKELAGASYCK